ncbi:MAG TPA: sulfotransferase [Micromonosporaceae bacterium]|nr:sulfotransferase [Micromonosporaceae bacterium]HCU51539.1 sulfotransferase [Micromonosporaceae bacterium]
MRGEHVPDSVKRVVHFGSRSIGRLTAAARMLPSFLICGGQRCGTTSLYRALTAHPVVLKAVLHKGVHYFDTNYHRGMAWYQGHFPLRRTAARVEREHGFPAHTFESSPYYLYHPHAGARIARDLPGVKLIVLVRDPVERAYSQHAHELARGFETEPDFGRALDLEPVRLAGQRERIVADPHAYSFSHQHHGYRSRGEYASYLEKLAGHVGRERILVVQSEQFFVDPKPVYDSVLDFLGLPHLGYPEFEQHNARPRSTKLDPQVRADLTAHFAAHDAALQMWLTGTPSWRA